MVKACTKLRILVILSTEQAKRTYRLVHMLVGHECQKKNQNKKAYKRNENKQLAMMICEKKFRLQLNRSSAIITMCLWYGKYYNHWRMCVQYANASAWMWYNPNILAYVSDEAVFSAICMCMFVHDEVINTCK